MSGLVIGYARVSTDEQDLTAQRDGLARLGVEPERIYVDHGLTGTTRARPGLREALAACRDGDTLVVTKLDRLARSLPDARDIADELTARQVKLNLGGSVHNPTDPVGRLLFNVLAMVAEFRSGPDSDEDSRRHEGRPRQRAATRQAAHAQPPPGSSPRRPPQCRDPYQRRACRTLLRRPLDGLPSDPTGRLTSGYHSSSRYLAAGASFLNGDPRWKSFQSRGRHGLFRRLVEPR
jgi:DNA invertase Pin-like site-specific DNA recombinase